MSILFNRYVVFSSLQLTSLRNNYAISFSIVVSFEFVSLKSLDCIYVYTHKVSKHTQLEYIHVRVYKNRIEQKFERGPPFCIKSPTNAHNMCFSQVGCEWNRGICKKRRNKRKKEEKQKKRNWKHTFLSTEKIIH